MPRYSKKSLPFRFSDPYLPCIWSLTRPTQLISDLIIWMFC
jgi:hypothetical protein